jgi:hypothetical protein
LSILGKLQRKYGTFVLRMSAGKIANSPVFYEILQFGLTCEHFDEVTVLNGKS